jgi:hypothetical protein
MDSSSLNFAALALEDNFNIRRLIYENRELFHEFNNQTDILSQSLSKDEKEKLDEVRSLVQQGRDILSSEIHHYKELITQKLKMVKFETDINMQKKQLLQYLLFLKTAYVDAELDETYLQDHLDTIEYEFDGIIQNALDHIGKKRKALDESIEKSISIIKYMGTVYDTFRNTSLGHVCPICLHNEIEVYCTPCGHTICSNCAKGAYYCCMCRCKIDKTCNLFLA